MSGDNRFSDGSKIFPMRQESTGSKIADRLFEELTSYSTTFKKLIKSNEDWAEAFKHNTELYEYHRAKVEAYTLAHEAFVKCLKAVLR